MQRSKALGLISDINVVPYVDVMLVLLVIFMITAPLMTQGVVVDLPDVPADPVHGRVMLGIALLQQAGARQVVLPTEAPEEERER